MARKKTDNFPFLIIGGAEWIGLPELGIPQLRGRIDTGAHSSALHTIEEEVFEKDGQDWVRFVVGKNEKRTRGEWQCEAPVVRTRKVKNTSGVPEERITIQTPIRIGGLDWPVDITLTNREKMSYRFLLGRSAMQDRVLVNPSHAYLHGRPRKFVKRKKQEGRSKK